MSTTSLRSLSDGVHVARQTHSYTHLHKEKISTSILNLWIFVARFICFYCPSLFCCRLFACLVHVFVCAHVCACGLCPSSSFYSSIRLPNVVRDRLVLLMPIEEVAGNCSSGRTCGGNVVYPLLFLLFAAYCTHRVFRLLVKKGKVCVACLLLCL